jgi:hypothetical protein
MGKVSPGQVRQGSLGQTRADVLNSVTKPIGPVACSLPMLGKFVPSKFSENTQNRSPQDSSSLQWLFALHSPSLVYNASQSLFPSKRSYLALLGKSKLEA